MVNFLLHLKRLSLTLLLVSGGITFAYGQQKTVSGIVTLSPRNEPYPGVTVRVKGTNQGATTDQNGKYALKNVANNATLVFSAVGLLPQEHKITATDNTLNVEMLEDQRQLQEVVVQVGYGSQKKRDVTGAISSVNAQQIQQRQAIDVYDALQGQIPGMQIAQESGRPGAGNSVRIRGIGTLEGGADPLYVVDGVQGVNIDGINPQDIESIEVLRDAASAAIYGARSANGVIIITTKKGKAGKPRINLNYLQSFSSLARKLPQANARERRLYEAKMKGSTDPAGAPTDSLNPSTNADNDYQDLLTRTAIRRQVDLSLGGGSENMNYYASVGYLKDQGIIINSFADILRARFNLDYKASKRLTYSNRVQFSYSDENRISEGNTLNQALQRPPNFRVYLPDGSLAGNLGGRKNPIAEALLRKNFYKVYNASFFNRIAYKVIDGLVFTTDVNLVANYAHHLEFSPKLLSNNNDVSTGGEDNAFRTYWQIQTYLNYEKTLNKKHTLGALLGFSADRDSRRGANIEGQYYVSEEINTLNAAQELNLRNTNTDASRNSSASVFGRLSYNFKSKYLLNFNVRADGSSRFGTANKWGYFPSISAGWRLSDESFMAWSRKVLYDAKVRVSYGITGNDQIDNNASRQRYVFGSNYYNDISGVVPASLFGNNTVGWESLKQFNLGLDLLFYDGRLSVTADYYNKITNDLLYRALLPNESGYTERYANFGSIQNRGIEIAVSGYPIKNKDFDWNLGFNFSINNNTVKKLLGASTMLVARSGGSEVIWRIREGGRLGDFYGYKYEGIYSYKASNAYTDDGLWQRLSPVIGADGKPTGAYTLNGAKYTGNVRTLSSNGDVFTGGDVIWQNTVKDGVIDDADRVVLGNAQPKWTGGVFNSFNYKNFSLSFNVYISWGGTIYNRQRQQLNAAAINNVTPEPDFIYNSWVKEGDNAVYQRPDKAAVNNARELSSLYLEDASFIRLRNLKVGYSLTPELRRRWNLPAVNVYVYGNNLLNWSNYRGYDPEIAFNSPLRMGVDEGRYPRKKEVGFGINVNF
ncbi:TonB-dependent receptor [Chitinophaga pendula]|uniref:SusC/RagA family TonB-linked outer membrane protein n=1 Tax=Chitinophaga TaxID=79328 RepID=UPI0012FDDE15|nr:MULTISPECIES: TonB-dependent receptor [Chitinophaga]UCJ05885.1 TonB-dependent receptor [Chitinophaga pendula]